MLAIHPARRMSATMLFRHWWSRHSGASSICEAVPPIGKIVSVTFEDISSVLTWGTIGFAKFGVAGTLSWCCLNQNEKKKSEQEKEKDQDYNFIAVWLTNKILN